jgi:hypothetical protein
MIQLFAGLFLILPFIGLLIATGSPSSGADVPAALAYGVYLLCIGVAYFAVRRCRSLVVNRSALSSVISWRPFISYASVALLILLAILGAMFGLFGALGVLTGEVDKEVFRSSQGALGPLLAIATKYLTPALFIWICFLYRWQLAVGARAYWLPRMLVVLAAAFTALVGLCLGSKTGAVWLLAGGVCALFWNRTRITNLATMGLASALLVAGSAYFFDAFLDRDPRKIASYIYERVFHLTSEVPARAWEDLVEEQPTVDYSPTLLAFGGGPLLHWLTGVRRGDDDYYKYEFTRAVSAHLYPSEMSRVNSGEWNLTPTAFSEAVMALGVYGIPVFGLVTGALLAGSFNLVEFLFRRGRLISATLILTYVVMVFLSWVNSGGLPTLLHAISLAGCAFAFVVIRLIMAIFRVRQRPPAVAPARCT